MDDQQYLTAFEELLSQLVFSNTDTARIQTATTTLKSHFYTQARCVPALAELVYRSEQPQIRQLAAVELRKQNTHWWKKLDDTTKATTRNRLLECVMKETEMLVRNAIARAISSIAHEESLEKDWPELLPILYQCITTGNVGQREIGIYVLYTLLDVLIDHSSDQLHQLVDVFRQTLVDPESREVRITTLQSLSTLAEFVSSDDKEQVKLFQHLVPTMVTVLQRCVAENDEVGLAKGFDALDTMLLLEAPILSRHLPQLVEFSLGVGANKTLDESARVVALSFLFVMIIYKKTRIQRSKLVTPMIQHLMPIATEEDPDDADDDSPSRVALRTIQSLATNLPPQHVFPTLFQIILEYMASPTPGYRKAAMMAFGASVEGCADFMRPKINDLMQLVFAGLRDPEVVVCKAACVALSCVADEIVEAVISNHTTLMPLVLSLMDKENQDITKYACSALGAILEGIGNDILQYLPVLMEKMIALIDKSSGEMLCTVVSTIGSAAQTAGKEFVPYFPEVMARLQPMTAHQSEQDDMMLRGTATDTAGALASAVGKDIFRPYLEPMMKLAIEGLQIHGSRLRETSYSFFTLMATVFGEDMAPFLPAMMPELLHTCAQDETSGAELVNSEDEVSLGEEDYGSGDNSKAAFHLNTALGDEKEVAADAIGELVEATRSHFMPYTSECLNALVVLLDHYSDGVRKSSIAALLKFVATFYDMSSTEKWAQGLPLQYPVHENVASVIQLVMPAMLQMWEDEKEVVIALQQELAEALKRVGPCLIIEHVGVINTYVLQVFEGKLICQQPDEEDEELGVTETIEEDEDQTELDAMLISSGTEMVGALALVLGSNFIDYLRVYLPHVARYCAPSRSISERSMAIGCLGEVASGLRSGITEFTETIFSLTTKALQDSEEEVRSNAAYSIGILCQYTMVDVSSQYPAILQALNPLLQSKLGNAIDNACGAVARLIIAHPEAINLEEVLPILVQQLPLKTDYNENEPVYHCLIQLVHANNPTATGLLPRIRQAIEQTLLPPEEQLTTELRVELAHFIQSLSG